MAQSQSWRKKYPLAELTWEDSTSMASWLDEDELHDFITDAAWKVTSVGYIVSETPDQITLCGRITDDGKQVGLVERIPRRAVISVTELQGARRSPFPERSTQ